MSSGEPESILDDARVGPGSAVSIRLVTAGKSVTLSSGPKWRRAIQLGDLTPDTLVEVERGSGSWEQHSGSSVPELTALFEEHGFRLEIEPTPAPLVPLEPETSPPAEAEDGEPEKITSDAAQEAPAPPKLAAKAVPPLVSAAAIPAVKLNSWQDVASVEPLGPDPVLPHQQKWKGGERATRARAFRKDARRTLSAAPVLVYLAALVADPDQPALFLFGAAIISFWLWPKQKKEDRLKLKAVVKATKEEWDGLLKRWNASASAQAYDRERSKALAAHQALEAMVGRRQAALAKLNDRSLQMREHLTKFAVDHRQIPGIGQGRAAVLRAGGFRTAADISGAIQYLPGFGPALTASLHAWRASCERTFVHDPRRSESPAEIKRIDLSFAAEKQRLQQPMHGAARRLYDERIRTLDCRAELLPKLENAWDQYQTARLKLRAL